MTHVMATDERRRRLDSGADLRASERYDGSQPCSDLNINVASLNSKIVDRTEMQMAGYENKIEIAHRTAVNNTTLHNACRINE